MASSDVPRALHRRPRRGRLAFFLALLLVLVVGLYTLGWYYVAGRIETETEAALQRLGRTGVAADCVNAEARGYPFSIGLFCDAARYDDRRKGVSLATGALRSTARITDPFQVTTEVDGPATWDIPGPGALQLSWERLQSSVRLAQPLPESVSLELSKGALSQTANGGASLGAVDGAEAHLQARGPDLLVAASVSGFSAARELLDGRVVPALDGSTDIVVAGGMLRAAEGGESLRGLSGEIRRLSLSSGPAGSLTLTGPFEIGEDGLIEADFVLSVSDPRAVSALLGEVFPEEKDKIETGFGGLALMGDNAALPLRIRGGRAALAFIPLGDIPPLP